MDWAKTVRALRLRLRLKQGAMAELIGVSQTYISRLESGLVEPAPHVAEAINALSSNPRTRSTFDDFLATIRYSPFPAFLVQPEPENGRYTVEAVSAGIDDDCVADMTDLAECEALAPLREQIDTICQSGLRNGEVLSATAFWCDARSPRRYWATRYTPVRDEAGQCFLHGTLSEQNANDHAESVREAGSDLVIERFGISA
ncbi:helix-turn-helix domain-containing protein [Maricaulis parjimensis]|uniref:helix-turn-helix domain-containing protein n=1 Tax=Maricaulis parjimensis TaxID=144023 RepID=UPI00193A8B56|nr:helix-turn-helix transcriptional regulator [Maricaulis parjimensis]